LNSSDSSLPTARPTGIPAGGGSITGESAATRRGFHVQHQIAEGITTRSNLSAAFRRHLPLAVRNSSYWTGDCSAEETAIEAAISTGSKLLAPDL
jgi:hypothetical protein